MSEQFDKCPENSGLSFFFALSFPFSFLTQPQKHRVGIAWEGPRPESGHGHGSGNGG